ncbi:MAG: exopolyphosphatase [Magnetococcales bacterium]|nr:exopolyphosphatase [Magnetococcales bacterium]NGZ05388.1 exopolyphosphatase [Magnetococcales bacterium]
MSQPQKYRLVTRSDFDGLVSAMLLRDLDIIDEILFVQPKDMQDGRIPITERDIITNLPYVDGAHLVLDHHASEVERAGESLRQNHIIHPEAASAARVVYNHFGGKSAFPHVRDDILDAVDKADSGQLDEDDVLYPKGWMLLNFIMDPRTGLGRFKEFRVSNYQLMMDLIEYCRRHSVEEVLALPDVQERVEFYFEQEELFKTQIQTRTKIHNNLAVLDLRHDDIIYPGSRFMIYALYPQCNISLHVLWGPTRKTTVYALGKSIFNRTSKTHIGSLCLQFGGGGHAAAGTCQVPTSKAIEIRKAIEARILADG